MDDPGSWCTQLALTDGQWCFLVSTVCVVLSLFFSATNLALRNISWVKVEEAFERRNQSERTGGLREHFQRLASSASILRLLANLGLLLCVVQFFTAPDGRGDGVWPFWPMLKAFLVAAVVLLVFSLAIPHAWGQHAGTSLLVRCYPILRTMAYLTWPIASVLSFFDPLVRRLAGVAGPDANGSLEEEQEELLSVVEEGEKKGIVDEEEREMIASVLEFRDQNAGEIMTPRTDVVGVEADISFTTAVEVVTGAGHSRYPVYEGSIDKVIGMLYAKDLLEDLNRPDTVQGIQHRLREAYFVPEGKSLRDLLHDFQNRNDECRLSDGGATERSWTRVGHSTWTGGLNGCCFGSDNT